jgi:ribosomal protein S17E
MGLIDVTIEHNKFHVTEIAIVHDKILVNGVTKYIVSNTTTGVVSVIDPYSITKIYQ